MRYFKMTGTQNGQPAEIEWQDGEFVADPGFHCRDSVLAKRRIRVTPTGPAVTAGADDPVTAMMTAAATFDTPVFEVTVDPDDVLADFTAAISVPADAIP